MKTILQPVLQAFKSKWLLLILFSFMLPQANITPI